jgi:hypothetical protein
MTARDLPSSSLQSAISAAALKRIGRARKRVVFLVHSPETFSALEPVIEEMQRRPEAFDLVFFALPRSYSGLSTSKFSGMESTFVFLDQKGLKPIGLAGRSMADLETLVRLAPDYIFRQAPWDQDVPSVFDTTQLGFAHLCYVPYGLAMVETPEYQYNQRFHNACDFIFCESEFEYAAYANHRVMGTQGVRMTGYPRFERFIAELAASDANAWPVATPAGTPRVIWAPHHSLAKEWLCFSTFMEHKDAMLREAERGRISLLLRPHPALRERLGALGLMTPAQYDAYVQAFASAGCSGVDTEREYIRSFAASDALITDGLGFFSEYMLTGKPLIRTRRSDSVALNSFAQWLVEACHNVDDAWQLRDVLEALATGHYVDELAAQRGERQQHLTALGQGASQRIVDTLQTW